MSEIHEMTMGARGIIRQYAKDGELTWTRMFCEWLDNTLDAGGMTFDVTKNSDEMLIVDDGRGCPDPKKLVNLGESYEHSDERSGYFGLGGKVSGIRASRGTKVEYTTTSGGKTYRVTADWGKMTETNRLFYEQDACRDALPHEKGTRIKIWNCMKFKDLDRILRDLSFRYADWINDGLRIIFKVDGDRHVVTPFVPPKFDDKIDFKFTCNGLPVRGYCGLVAPGELNPYPGWVFHWGPHRVLTTKPDPANGKSVRRLHGHVYLPTAWRNHNMTKDDFSDSPEELYDLIAEHCGRIIDASDEASTSFEIRSFMDSVETMLNASFAPKVKGRRPGSSGQEGTVEPANSGRRHKEFGPHQPGDKGKPRNPTGTNRIHRAFPFKLEWDENLDGPWSIEISQSSRSPSRIYLNKSNAALFGFHERNDPAGLMVVVYVILSNYLGRHKEKQPLLGFAGDYMAEEIFKELTTNPEAKP